MRIASSAAAMFTQQLRARIFRTSTFRSSDINIISLKHCSDKVMVYSVVLSLRFAINPLFRRGLRWIAPSFCHFQIIVCASVVT
jgi:hypothetical protein